MYRPSRIGEQLELDLAGPGRPWLEPWEGRSPRSLTKASQMFKLSAIPPGGAATKRGFREQPAPEKRLQLEQLELPFDVEVL